MDWRATNYQVHVGGELYSVYQVASEWAASRVHGTDTVEVLGRFPTLARALLACETRRLTIEAGQCEQVEGNREVSSCL